MHWLHPLETFAERRLGLLRGPLFDFFKATVNLAVHIGLVIVVEGQGRVDLGQAQMRILKMHLLCT